MRYLFTLFLVSIFIFSFCQDEYVYQSDYLNEPDTVWVFTPDDYNGEKEMPVIYMLHGWSGKYYHWDLMIDCQKYANRYHSIIVCPDGLYDSWYIDSPVESENKYASFFKEELIPSIERKYSVNSDSIFITGLSMGGHGSLYLFSQLPEYFSSAGSLSGLLDLRKWVDHYGISSVIGTNSNNSYENLLLNYSVIGNINSIKPHGKSIIVSCGTEDPFYQLNLEFIEYCNSQGINNTFLKSTGAHDADYWRSNVADHFEFFFR